MKVQELFEAKYPAQPVGDLAIVPWVEEHAKKFSSDPKPIYRGSHDRHNIVLVNTNQIDRSSRNTYNFYTLWMDNHPSWAEYPKRSKSLICSTSYDTARGYNSSTRVIIPDDSCKIGVCRSGDLWYSFPAIKSFFKRAGINALTMDSANSKFAQALHELLSFNAPHNDESEHEKELEGTHELTWPILKKLLEEFTTDLIRDTVREKTGEWESGKLRRYINLAKIMERSGKDNMFELFTELMSPEKNGFKLIDPSQLKSLSHDIEIWIGGGHALSVEWDILQLDQVFKSQTWHDSFGDNRHRHRHRQQDGQEWEAFH